MKSDEKLLEETNNLNSSNEIIQRHEIENCPFSILATEGKVFGVMGKYRITEPLSYPVGNEKKRDLKIKALEKEVSQITWNRIVQVIIILLEDKYKIEQEISKALEENKS